MVLVGVGLVSWFVGTSFDRLFEQVLMRAVSRGLVAKDIDIGTIRLCRHRLLKLHSYQK